MNQDPPAASILKWFHASNTGTPKVSTTNDRASLLDKYLSCTDFTHIRTSAANCHEDVSACSHCKSASRTAMIQDGYMFCNNCFTVEYILVDHDKPSYKDPPKEITYFAYKRINHFNEWLNTVQGKETTLIPDEMFDKILLELKKLRITNLSELSNTKMKDILKKLRPEGGSRYYEHIPHIITKLNGLPTPHLPPELEERLRHMFCQIQVPFLKHACALNPARKNFLSYSYVLNKFMQLLEKDQYLSSFPLLTPTLGARVQEAMPVLVSCAC
ncbi:putative transcription factor [Tetrabaena socialis]|uniref:Putative transcription factor n=1 Tax=Tetrabaena socialis TaxID=47790 RepID=A0A2J7ZJG8_9CHLO|nr:putative transcription factor [Tetrabaena socialis]|eukprot:PNH00407.1 putative transcription factor [Tetrabaena socialis]